MRFESDVIPEFESDVIPDSGKTEDYDKRTEKAFESDVIPDSGKIKISSSIGQGRFCLVYCF